MEPNNLTVKQFMTYQNISRTTAYRLVHDVISTRLQNYPKEHNAVLKYLDRGGNPERVRLAVHEWERHDRKGSVLEYAKKDD